MTGVNLVTGLAMGWETSTRWHLEKGTLGVALEEGKLAKFNIQRQLWGSLPKSHLPLPFLIFAAAPRPRMAPPSLSVLSTLSGIRS
jgi:hypothetical protein